MKTKPIDITKPDPAWERKMLTLTAIDARTEEQEAAIGQHLADALGLKKSRDEKGRYETAWGTKTPLGLYRTIKRVIEEGPLS